LEECYVILSLSPFILNRLAGNSVQHKILLVEDDPEISEMVRNYLVIEGSDVTHAFDGDEAVRLFNIL
jgi:PleD family two-component response regulator